MDVSQGHCCGGTVGTGLAQLWQSPLVCRGTLSSWGFPTSFGAEVWGSHWPVPGRDLGRFSAPAGPGLVPESVWNCFQDLTPLLPKRSRLFLAQNFSGVLSGPAGAPCLLGVGSDPFCPLVFSIHFPHGTRLQTPTGQCRRGLRGICLASSHEQPGAFSRDLALHGIVIGKARESPCLPAAPSPALISWPRDTPHSWPSRWDSGRTLPGFRPLTPPTSIRAPLWVSPWGMACKVQTTALLGVQPTSDISPEAVACWDCHDSATDGGSNSRH